MKNKQLKGSLFFSKTNDFLNVYLPEQAGKSVNTVETYRDGLTVFRRYVTDIKAVSIRKFMFSDCTSDFMLDYLAWLRTSGCEASTCNNRLAALRAYLWYASDMDISLQSIALSASHVPFIREPRKKRDVIADEDLAALFLAPPETKTGTRDRTLLILLYDSAVRVSELLDLKVGSLRLGKSPCIVVHGKGDKERVVSITDKTAAHLEHYFKLYHPENDKGKPLFYTTIKGNTYSMSAGNVARIINKYVEQIRQEHPNLPEKVHPHMFRRTRATSLYQSGIELELVSVILGHASTQTTRIYATPSMEMMRGAMQNVMGVLPEEAPEWTADEDELARLCGLR